MSIHSIGNSPALTALAGAESNQSAPTSEAKDTPQQKLQDAAQEARTGVRDGDETGGANGTGKSVNTSA